MRLIEEWLEDCRCRPATAGLWRMVALALLLAGLVLAASGCANENRAYVTAADTFSATVETATEAYHAGLLEPEHEATLDRWVPVGNAALVAWDTALDLDEPTTAARATFHRAIAELLTVIATLETESNDADDGTDSTDTHGL